MRQSALTQSLRSTAHAPLEMSVLEMSVLEMSVSVRLGDAAAVATGGQHRQMGRPNRKEDSRGSVEGCQSSCDNRTGQRTRLATSARRYPVRGGETLTCHDHPDKPAGRAVSCNRRCSLVVLIQVVC
eukprot:1101219-Rhodomonas_salina.2